MPRQLFSISDFLILEEGLPRLRWEQLKTWIETHSEPAKQRDTWTAIIRQWLEKLQGVLGPDYSIYESNHFLILASHVEPSPQVLLESAETYRQELLGSMPGLTAFQSPGDQVLLCLKDPGIYYRYVAVYYSEGIHGGSGGMQIRDGYPHIVFYGSDFQILEHTLAHEMTHAAFSHLSLPQWIDEGLAQMFEHGMTGRRVLLVNEEMAHQHKRFWNKHGLDLFWNGEGFSRPDRGQQLSYELAEILVRMLSEDYRPRWFGWDKTLQRRFFAFLLNTKVEDCGESAAREHLRIGLGELASRFLGPGDWSPNA